MKYNAILSNICAQSWNCCRANSTKTKVHFFWGKCPQLYTLAQILNITDFGSECCCVADVLAAHSLQLLYRESFSLPDEFDALKQWMVHMEKKLECKHISAEREFIASRSVMGIHAMPILVLSSPLQNRNSFALWLWLSKTKFIGRLTVLFRKRSPEYNCALMDSLSTLFSLPDCVKQPIRSNANGPGFHPLLLLSSHQVLWQSPSILRFLDRHLRDKASANSCVFQEQIINFIHGRLHDLLEPSIASLEMWRSSVYGLLKVSLRFLLENIGESMSGRLMSSAFVEALLYVEGDRNALLFSVYRQMKNSGDDIVCRQLLAAEECFDVLAPYLLLPCCTSDVETNVLCRVHRYYHLPLTVKTSRQHSSTPRLYYHEHHLTLHHA